MRHDARSFTVDPIKHRVLLDKTKSEEEKTNILFGALNDLIEKHNTLAKFVVANQNDFENAIRDADIRRRVR